MNGKLKLETWDKGNDLVFTTTANGRSKDPSDFNVLQEYLECFREKPSVLDFFNQGSDYFDYNKLMKYLKKEFGDNFEVLFEDVTYNFYKEKKLHKKQVFYIAPGYIMQIENSFFEDYFNDEKPKNIKLDKLDLIIETNEILIPRPNSPNKNEKIENKLIEIFKKAKIDHKYEEVSLGMVSVEGNDLYVEDFHLNKKLKDIEFPDLHYGEGFEDWHQALLKRLREETKGLVLLHGPTGTGKSYFVRQLLKELTATDKNILYFPASMVSSITDPSFINFISSWAAETDKKGILLIEDAEPLLESRESTRNMGITNLLNLTDGLLNDILGIQIIATFNVDLGKIDKALQRPERLIARKEFGPLSLERALKLGEKLEIDPNEILSTQKDELTLAEIYAIKKNSRVLEHNIAKPKSMGFKK